MLGNGGEADGVWECRVYFGMEGGTEIGGGDKVELCELG